MNAPTPPPFPAFAEAVRFWLKLGFISFGGPAGQIAIMHRELVESRRWISERHFLNGLNFCMLLPGPEAQQLATYLGWRLHGAKGGIAAGALFVLPSMFIMFGLSWIYMAGASLPWLTAIFHALLGAVIAVIFEAVLRIGKKALHGRVAWVVAALSLVAIFHFKISFVIIILSAGLLGWIGRHRWPEYFPAGKGHGSHKGMEEILTVTLPPPPPTTWMRSARVIAFCLLLWWVPVVCIATLLGWHSTPAQQGIFFSKAALITFGGAYAVLPYVAQQAVEHHGWLTLPQMMGGLALAETTPGPLIMVLQFVGFAGGWQSPGGMSPLAAAALCSFTTTWVTFVPCFLFIFLCAPIVEKLHDRPRLSAALATITAAVVGVILNLAITLSSHALWPEGKGTDWLIAFLAVASFAALKWSKLGLIPVIGLCGLAGLLAHGLEKL